MLVLHNTRETLTDCLIGGYALVHDLYGQNVTTIYHKYAMSVWCADAWAQDDVAMMYDLFGCKAYDALVSLLGLALLLKSLLFLFLLCMTTFAQCTNQDSYCVYVGTNLRHTRWYVDSNMIWYVCNVWCRSLMCTSNIAGNTQMASLDRQVTQNGLGVNNAIARGIYNGVIEVTIRGNDERWCCRCCTIPN